MIGRVSRKTETDSLTFVKNSIKLQFLKGYNNAEDLKKILLCRYLSILLDGKTNGIFEKFENQYQEFWNEERLAKEKNSTFLERNLCTKLSFTKNLAEKQTSKNHRRIIP